MLNATETSERDFLQSFKIQTDLAEDADEDASPWVPFVWRSWQSEMYDQIQWFQKRKRPAKLRLPKARGTGASSFSIALFGFCRTLRRPGYRTLIIAQDQTESEEHLSRLTDFYEQVDWKALEALGITRERANRTSLIIVFRDPRTKRFIGRSRVRVRTAKAKGLGRGGGYDAVLTTERPHWPEKCKRDLKGFLARLSRTPWSAHIDESSPNGLDSFYKDCLGAEKGKGGYHLFFIPSFRRPENYKRFDDEQQRHDLVASLGAKDEYGASLEMEHYQRCLAYWANEGMETTEAETKALSFMHWRREEIEGNCGGSVAHWCQEHGTTMEESFQGSDRPVFKTHISNTWVQAAHGREWTRGNLIEKVNDVIFEPHPGGLWLVDEGAVLPENFHCFGMDLASGRAKLSGTNDDADFTDICVDDVYSGRTVAQMHAHIWTHEVPAEVLKAAWFFRRRGEDQVARGIIELNMDHGAVANQVERADTFWGTGSECLILLERKTKTSISLTVPKEYGFWTSGESKPELLRGIHEFIDEVGSWKPDMAIRCPWTREQLEEISRYVYIQKTDSGRVQMGAESGHDDRVISKALALMARRTLIEWGEVPLSSRVPKKLKLDPIDEFYLGAHYSKAADAKRAPACLGRAF